MRRALWPGAILSAVFLSPAGARPTDLGSVRVPEPPVSASAADCRVVDIEFTPAPKLQIVAWIEDEAGNYIDTAFVTQGVGVYGLGNRAGLFGMRSGPRWPYGPRTDVFPVWSHRHGLTWPVVHFQNGDGDPGGAYDCTEPLCRNDTDRNLSHPFNESSLETHYMRPVRPDEMAWDTGTTASMVFVDKGRLSPSLTTRYPPRADHAFVEGIDHPDVQLYAELNPFDAVSQATPPADLPFRYTWLIPPELYDAAVQRPYVLFVEVSKEFDDNATYNPTTQPPIAAAGWNDYGLAYRGQPSVVYRVPFTIGPQESRVSTARYAGYGDPLGNDGAIRPPDATINDDPVAFPGSGAQRLALVHDALTDTDYQVRVDARYETDDLAPGRTDAMTAARVTSSTAQVTFLAPGDDGMAGRASGYDVRMRTDGPVTLANFSTSQRLFTAIEPGVPGTLQTLDLEGLIPVTTYYLGVRAYDSCRNYGPLTTLAVTTVDRERGQVDACFVATAAYGSAMANDVGMLRRFRDAMLRDNVLGELAVETYYTFGPGLAGVVGESELLRATARAALEPVVARVRGLAFGE
jgi:hypothetical protein